MNVTQFIDLWAQGDAATSFFRKQVLLLFGHRDVAKNNFIQFLAQNGSDHPIKDTFDPTLAPVIVHTVSSNLTICDFDSFDDSAEGIGLPLGISATYLLKKIINSTDELQIILLINFSSTKREIDKHLFTRQMRKISSWIKNIDSYADSIGLIVTNVANAAENQVLVEFDQILNHLQTFLEQLQKENSQNEAMLKLLNILLRKTNGTDYKRSGIFRQPNNQASNQEALVQNERLKIRALLSDIRFSVTNMNDFNFYTQPATSAQILTSSIGDELDERIAEKLNNVFRQMRNEFEKDFHRNYAEVRMKLEKMESIRSVTQTKSRNIREVLLDFESKLKKLDVDLPRSFLEDVYRLNDYLQFLVSVDSNLQISEWPKTMAEITDYIDGFHRWNDFLREMDFVTSSYAVQKNSEKLRDIFIDQPVTEVNDTRMQQFVKDFHHQSRLVTHYNDIVGQRLSSLKILSLESIFKSNLKPGFTYEHSNSTGVTDIFGEYLILSDIISKFPAKKFLCLNAASKIFIDVNITRSYDGRPFQLFSIISPVWELMQDSRIVLDGKNGFPSFRYSATGYYPGGTGGNGHPGYPGKSAGHFLGIGDLFVHNGRSLLISANGGRGGNGSNGGQGGEGSVGDSAVTDNCERKADFESYPREELSGVLFHEYCVYGGRGGDGGQGGNGGVGAAGGFAGDITLVGFENETNIRTSRIDGLRGEDGKGGAGGEGGMNGKSYKITKKAFWWGKPQCNRESNDFCGRRNPASKGLNGARGLDAYERETLQNPIKIEHPHLSSLLLTYRKYLMKNVQAEGQNEKKLRFLEKLNTNPSFADLDTATTLAEEFFYLDTQYRISKNFSWISYFEQLLYRTERYLTTEHSSNDAEMAKMAQAAILAKLISIKNQRARNFIINLKNHLESQSEQIKDFNSKSRASLISRELWSRKSELRSFLLVGDGNASVIANNMAEITDLILVTQTDMSVYESYEHFEHKIAVLRTLVTMKDTFHFLHFIEEIGLKIIESTLPVGKFFFSESEIPVTVTSEIRNSVHQLTEIQLDSWRKRLEPVFKNLVDDSSKFSLLNSQLKQNYNSLLETKNVNFYENRKNIREFARKIVLSTGDPKTEEQNFIEKLGKMWFLCEAAYENCHLLENHKNMFSALRVTSTGFVFSKVQQFSDNIMEILESFFSAALVKPQDIVLSRSTLTNSLREIQILFLRIRKTFKIPLPELVENSLDALEADTKRMECFYTDLAHYQETKRFESAFKSGHSLSSDLDNSISLSMLHRTYRDNVLIPFYQMDFPFAYNDAEEVTAENCYRFKIEALTAIDTIGSKIKRGPIPDGLSATKRVELTYSKLSEVYRWKGEERVKTIENLLRGKPVTLKADILKYTQNKRAIRMKNVNLELQTKNETLQSELDEDLKHFAVTVKHFGMSYYKCRDSIFTYTHTPLSIYHSFGGGWQQNMVYVKLKDSDFLLSPFTIWRMQLSGTRDKSGTGMFRVLEKYRNLDIVLKADVVYLRDDDSENLPFTPNGNEDYCDSNAMRKYYKNEDILMKSAYDVQEERIPSTRAPRFKREVGYGVIAPSEVIENKELNYSSNIELSNYQIMQWNQIPVLNIAEAEGRGTKVCSDFRYNLNDCLVLLSLIVQRVTNSKQHSYFEDCAVDYSKVRHCTLEIIRKFEESLTMFSKNNEGEYSFDPVSLMSELEKDIINNSGRSINEILLNAVSPTSRPVKETFFQRLWNKLMRA